MEEMGDMDELMALQAQLMGMQMQPAQAKLSERSVVEIILKLRDTQKLEFIFGKTGKDYITHERLMEEIKDEIFARGGRISVVELGPVLGVDVFHVENKVKDICKPGSAFHFLNSQIISEQYLDGMVEEVNNLLDDAGRLAIVDLAQRFDLPIQFIKTACEDRADNLLQGHISGSEIFTDSFVERHKGRVRGAFLAMTQPTPVYKISTRFKLVEDLALKQVQALIEGKLLPGKLKGSTSRSSYVPDIFSRNQFATVSSFFDQNGFIEYRTLTRNQIQNPKKYLKDMYPQGLQLDKMCLGPAFVAQLADAVEEAITTESFVNAANILPAPLTTDDVETALAKCLKNFKDVKQMDQTLAVADAFIEKCKNIMLPIVTTKAAVAAKEVAKKVKEGAHATVKDDFDSDDDNDSKRGKGKRRGKAQVVEEAPLSKKELRRKKAGAKGKKGRSRKDDSDSDEDAPPAKSKGKASKRGGEGKAKPAVCPINLIMITSTLTEELQDRECPESLIQGVAMMMKSELQSIYKKAIQAASAGGSDKRRKKHELMTKAIQELYNHLCIFHRAASALLPGGGEREDEEDVRQAGGGGRQQQNRNKSSKKAQARPQEDPDQVHHRALAESLMKHLMKTMGMQMVDYITRNEAMHQGVKLGDGKDEELPGATELTREPTTVDGGFSFDSLGRRAGVPSQPVPVENKEDDGICLEPLSAENRELAFSKLKRSASILQNLISLASQKSSTPFMQELEETLKMLGIWIRPLDKKVERNITFSVRKGMQAQLEQEQRPSAVFQYVVLVLFAQHNHGVLHAPNRLIADVLMTLEGRVSEEDFALLEDYNALLSRYSHAKRRARKNSQREDDEEDEEDEAAPADLKGLLVEQMPSIKALLAKQRGGGGEASKPKKPTTTTGDMPEEEAQTQSPKKQKKKKGRSRRAD